ncbi:hypothetical protein Ndes2437B_g01941 [Nannochloris sp. 'desiccata']
MRLSQVWLLTCIALQVIVFSAASAPRKLLQGSDVFPWFTGMPQNSMPDRSDTDSDSSAFAPSGSRNGNNGTATDEGDTSPPECPTISLKLNSIEVYDSIINQPDRNIVVVCYNRKGRAFAPVIFSTTSDVVRSFSGARYRPSESVAQIGCGDSVSCTVGFSEADSDSTFTTIAEGGCWFDYRHFTQLSYQEPMSAWTCTKPPVRYTLECAECTDPNFPWDDALALAGPPLPDGDGLSENPALNSIMVIISVSIVAGAVILVVTALLLRGRRRSIEENVRMTELIMSRGRDQANSQRRRRSSFKPPAVFVVGKPIDGPPPPGYTGPIVVVHCGDDEEEEEYYYDEAEESMSKGKVVEQEQKEGDCEIVGHVASGSRTSSSGGGSENGNNSMSSYKEGRIVRWPQIAIARPEEVYSEQGEQALNESEVAVDSSGDLDLATLNSEETVTVQSHTTEAAQRNTGRNP